MTSPRSTRSSPLLRVFRQPDERFSLVCFLGGY